MVIGRTEQAAATDSDSFAFSHAARGQTSTGSNNAHNI